MSLINCRDDFPILKKNKNLVYLDSASTTLVPQTVIDTVTEFLTKVVVSSRRGAYQLATKGAQIVESTRRSVAKFLNTDPKSISFHSTLPESICSFILGLNWKKDNRNKILISQSEHNDVFVALQRCAELLQIKTEIIPVTENGTVDVDALSQLLDSQTRIVAVNCIPVGTGFPNPIKKVAEIIHEFDAMLLCDATRAVGFTEIYPDDLGVDFMVFSGNIGLMGPPGTTIQWFNPQFAKSHKPGILGSNAVANVTYSSFDIAHIPEKFEPGIINIPGIIGIQAAVDYLNSFGIKQIRSHLNTLANKLIQGFQKLEGIKIYGGLTHEKTIFSFNLTEESISCHDVALFLDQSEIAVRSGLLCAHPLISYFSSYGVIQVSLHIYNSLKDIERLIETLRQILEFL